MHFPLTLSPNGFLVSTANSPFLLFLLHLLPFPTRSHTSCLLVHELQLSIELSIASTPWSWFRDDAQKVTRRETKAKRKIELKLRLTIYFDYRDITHLFPVSSSPPPPHRNTTTSQTTRRDDSTCPFFTPSRSMHFSSHVVPPAILMHLIIEVSPST